MHTKSISFTNIQADKADHQFTNIKILIAQSIAQTSAFTGSNVASFYLRNSDNGRPDPKRV